MLIQTAMSSNDSGAGKHSPGSPESPWSPRAWLSHVRSHVGEGQLTLKRSMTHLRARLHLQAPVFFHDEEGGMHLLRRDTLTRLLCTVCEAHGHFRAVVLRLWLQAVAWGRCEPTTLSGAVILSWGLGLHV